MDRVALTRQKIYEQKEQSSHDLYYRYNLQYKDKEAVFYAKFESAEYKPKNHHIAVIGDTIEDLKIPKTLFGRTRLLEDSPLEYLSVKESVLVPFDYAGDAFEKSKIRAGSHPSRVELFAGKRDYDMLKNAICNSLFNITKDEIIHSERFRDLCDVTTDETAKNLCLLEKLIPDVPFYQLPIENYQYLEVLKAKNVLDTDYFDMSTMRLAASMLRTKDMDLSEEILEEIKDMSFDKKQVVGHLGVYAESRMIGFSEDYAIRLARGFEKEQFKTVKEYAELCGPSATEEFFTEKRNNQNAKFYQLNVVELSKLCKDNEILLNDKERKFFNNLLVLPEGVSGVGVVFQNTDGSQKAEVINLETKERLNIKDVLECQFVDEYNAMIKEELEKYQDFSKKENVNHLKRVVNDISCRYLLNENVEKMLQDSISNIKKEAIQEREHSTQSRSEYDRELE